jgi:membrane protein insertase Oxa1/YidC/SpoIIIJ
MIKMILWALFFYIMFRFVTRFLLPVIKVTRTASAKMREMQAQMEQMQQKANNPAPSPKQPKVQEGDYIDYEEIK